MIYLTLDAEHDVTVKSFEKKPSVTKWCSVNKTKQ